MGFGRRTVNIEGVFACSRDDAVSGQFAQEPVQFIARHADDMFWSRICPGTHVGDELGKGRDPFLLQAVEFSREVAIDFGVARIMAAI